MTDYFRNVQGNNLSDTLSTSVNDSQLTLPVNTIAIWSSNGGKVIVDRGNSKEEIILVTGKSGNNLSVATGGRGLENTTAVGHDSGATVESVPLAGDWNDLHTGLNVEHNDTGTHKAALVTTLKASGAEVTTGTEDAKIVTPKAIKDAGIVAVNITDDGWTSVSGTWTYASDDGPTGVITVPSGAAAIYNVGDRIKITQTTVKYGIITVVADTALTVYFGTDYTLANAAITSPYYSHQKSPVGFPTSISKWTVEVKDTSSQVQSTPTQNTWYNLGSITISIPIGVWIVEYLANIDVYIASGAAVNQYVTLSTGNNSETDVDFTAYSLGSGGGDTTQEPANSIFRKKFLTLASKTSYYLNSRTTTASVTSIQFAGNLSTTIVRAICAYL